MDKCWNCGQISVGMYCTYCGKHKSGAQAVVIAPPQAFQPPPATPPAPTWTQGHVVNHPPPSMPVGSLQGGHIQDIGRGSVTNRASDILRRSDEGMVWEDSPHPVLLVGLAAKWALVIVISFLWAVGSGSGWGWVLLWIVASWVHLGMRFFELRGTLYRMTSQRLEVTRGMFTRSTVTYELHQLGDAVIVSTFLLRQVGRSNLRIGFLTLYGIREAALVRDLLRDSGQWEAQRIDKIRWR